MSQFGLGAVGLVGFAVLFGAARLIVRALTVPLFLIALALIAFGILEGPALVGYHHCGLTDYLLGGPRLHGFKFLGTAWCKQ